MTEPKVSRRELLITGAGLVATTQLVSLRPVFSALSATNPEAPECWYRRTLVGIEIGPTGANTKDQIYMSRATGKEMVEKLLLAKVEYAVLFMKDMEFAYYNSKAALKAPNLGERDLLRECIEEARPHNLPIIAYCQIQYDSSSWRAHPEWRMKDPQGNDLEPRLCFNSDYISYIKTIAEELMAYEISGFHFDMLDFGFGLPYGCWCDRCKTLFRETYQRDMPSGPTWDDAWDKMLEFRTASNTRFCQTLETFVHTRRPEISVDFNYHGYPPFTWFPGELPVKHADNGDFVTAEGLPFVFGHTNPSLLSLFMKGARTDGRVQGVTSRSVYDYHDFSVRPTAELKWEVMTYLAHGAQCTVVDKANYDGTLDYLVYERLGEVFDEVRRKREYFGYESKAEVGLYYSSRSRDWYAREETPKYFAAFVGAHKALMQAHIPMGILCDESISLERLRPFPVVYMPNAVVLSPKELDCLKRYVEEGGRLFITGLSGTGDNYGNTQARSSLEELIGARLVRAVTEYPDNYLRFPKALAAGEAAFLLEEVPADWPMLVWGPVAGYEAGPAKGYGELMTAFRTKDNMWSRHMSPNEVIGPAVLVNRIGKGIVVTVPAAIDTAFIQRYRMPEHRNLLRNIIAFLDPDPEVKIVAPASVEAVVVRDEKRNRLLVHLLAYSAPPTASADAFPEGREVLPPVMEESMTYRARIHVRSPISKVTAVGNGTEVSVQGQEVSILTSEVHEIVVLA